MTREEIIRNLKYTMKKHKNDIVNTFDTNISVMCKDILDYFEEQEPCEKCDYVEGSPFCLQYCPYDAERKKEQEPCTDAVSREAVIKLFNGNIGSESALILHMVKKLPSVTQKSGKWILLDECANSGYYCSNCQKKLVKEGWSNTVKKIKYCPNCGADMRGAE